MKKIYITPAMRKTVFAAESYLLANSITGEGTNTASVQITDTETEYNGEFATKQAGGYNVWNDAW